MATLPAVWRRVAVVCFVASAVVSATVGVAGDAHADQGLSRDTSYGVLGRAEFESSGIGMQGLHGMTVQADGAVLALSAEGTPNLLRRFLADGTPDTAFAAGGTLDFTTALAPVAWSLPADPHGTIVVLLSTSTEGTYLLRRYLPSGAVDGSFGTSGTVTVVLATRHDSVSLLVDRGARVLVSGASQFDNTTELHRYTTAGQPDATFGVSGNALVTDHVGRLGGVDASGRAVLVVAGQFGDWSSLMRVDASGSVDTTYGTGGTADLGVAFDTTVDVAADGSLVALTTDWVAPNQEIAITRLTPTGAADPTFAGGQRLRIGFADLQEDVSTASEFVWAIRVLPRRNGGFIALANSIDESAAAAITATGSLDATFGQGGRAILSRDLAMFDGGLDLTGAIEFFGQGRSFSSPTVIQRSIDISPWPPLQSPPGNLEAHVGLPGQIAVSWTPPVVTDPEAPPTSYVVAIRRGGDVSSSPTEQTSFALAGLQPGTYTVTVQGVDMFGTGPAASTTVMIPDPTTTTPGPTSPPPSSTPPHTAINAAVDITHLRAAIRQPSPTPP